MTCFRDKGIDDWFALADTQDAMINMSDLRAVLGDMDCTLHWSIRTNVQTSQHQQLEKDSHLAHQKIGNEDVQIYWESTYRSTPSGRIRMLASQSSLNVPLHYHLINLGTSKTSKAGERFTLDVGPGNVCC